MRAQAQARRLPKLEMGQFLLLTAISLAFFFSYASSLKAEDGEITKSHGYSRFGDLKYPADFSHLDYVNPNAPKGGEISTFSIGSFDNIHRYTHKGDHAVGASVFFETLMVGTADEVAEQIAWYRDHLGGVENLVLFPGMPGDSYDKVDDQLHRLAQDVMPQLA